METPRVAALPERLEADELRTYGILVGSDSQTKRERAVAVISEAARRYNSHEALVAACEQAVRGLECVGAIPAGVSGGRFAGEAADVLRSALAVAKGGAL